MELQILKQLCDSSHLQGPQTAWPPLLCIAELDCFFIILTSYALRQLSSCLDLRTGKVPVLHSEYQQHRKTRTMQESAQQEQSTSFFSEPTALALPRNPARSSAQSAGTGEHLPAFRFRRQLGKGCCVGAEDLPSPNNTDMMWARRHSTKQGHPWWRQRVLSCIYSLYLLKA